MQSVFSKRSSPFHPEAPSGQLEKISEIICDATTFAAKIAWGEQQNEPALFEPESLTSLPKSRSKANKSRLIKFYVEGSVRRSCSFPLRLFHKLVLASGTCDKSQAAEPFPNALIIDTGGYNERILTKILDRFTC